MEFVSYKPVLGEPRRPPVAGRPDPTTIGWRNGLLIRATNWLGDTLMSLPAVWRMSQFVPPPCGVFVLCPKGLAPVWRAAPWVSHVIPMDRPRVRSSQAAEVAYLQPGVVMVLPNSFGSAWDVAWRGIPVRLGRSGRGRGLLLTHRLPAHARRRGQGFAGRHQLAEYLELAGMLGDVPWDAECPALGIKDAKTSAAKFGVACGDGSRWLAVAPGAAYGTAKQWPVERFRQAAQWWTGRGGRVAAVGTVAERGLAEAVVSGLPGAVNAAGQTGLADLMAVLSAVDLVLANDSGTMHLAAALGTRGVAVFGSTDPTATGPLGAAWIIRQEPVDCAPCLLRTCALPADQYRCLRQVSVESVCAALQTFGVV